MYKELVRTGDGVVSNHFSGMAEEN